MVFLCTDPFLSWIIIFWFPVYCVHSFWSSPSQLQGIESNNNYNAIFSFWSNLFIFCNELTLTSQNKMSFSIWTIGFHRTTETDLYFEIIICFFFLVFPLKETFSEFHFKIWAVFTFFYFHLIVSEPYHMWHISPAIYKMKSVQW